jgi:hypothetical protein
VLGLALNNAPIEPVSATGRLYFRETGLGTGENDAEISVVFSSAVSRN